MQFGNWVVNAEAISFAGTKLKKFTIEKNQLLETDQLVVEGDMEDVYQWLLLGLQEEWMSDDDLYDLNFAFAYAAGLWNLEMDYDIFDKTVDYQYQILDKEEDDDDDDDDEDEDED